MILNLKRYISLLLVLMLLIGIIPKAYAAELPTDSTIPEETVSETVETTAPTVPTDPTDPTEPTGPPDETTEPTVVTEPAADTPMLMTAADDYGIMTAASTQSGVLLFDYADNGNYTSSLNSQITVGYKWNGTGSTKYCYLKNFGWHFARINNVPYADAINSVMSPKETLVNQITDAMQQEILTLPDSTLTLGEINRRIGELEEEMAVLLTYENALEIHGNRFSEIAEEMKQLKKEREALSTQLRNNVQAFNRLQKATIALDQADHRITEWSEETIRQLVHTVKVISKDHIKVYLYDGTEIDQEHSCNP